MSEKPRSIELKVGSDGRLKKPRARSDRPQASVIRVRYGGTVEDLITAPKGERRERIDALCKGLKLKGPHSSAIVNRYMGQLMIATGYGACVVTPDLLSAVISEGNPARGKRGTMAQLARGTRPTGR